MSLRSARSRIQALTGGVDFWLLSAGLFLAGFGLVMVYSASGVMAGQRYGDSFHFLLRQAAFGVCGVLLMVGISRLPRWVIYRPTYLWLTLAAGLLALTLVGPLAQVAGGASRWLRLGPVSFQPLEVVKLALALYLAYFFAAKQDRVRRFSIGFLPPFLVTAGLALLLLLQPDFGGAAVLCAILFLMSLVGGTRLSYLVISLLFAAGGAYALIVSSPYRFRRLFAFLDPFKDAQDAGFQIVQSLYAFGSGGLFGRGLGAGRQKLFFLPEAHNDFLMAVVGEETGFLGVSLVFIAIGLLLWRAFAVAARQEDLRDRFTAYGMALVLGLGFVLNLAVVLGTVPPKGVPLPFVSYGGSQLLASFIALGVLLNLSRGPEPAGRAA